jgi:hypothetical protein
MTGSIIHAGTNKGLYISTNGGNDWNQIGLNNQSVYKIVANNNNFIAFTSYGCYRSNDGGNTWNGFNIGLNNLQGLTLMGKDLYALTLDGVIWKRSFDDVMKVDETKGKLPTEFSLSQNYPNPFNPSTTINYQLPTFSFVSLKVYDILGREVATLVNEEKKAGYYSVEFNANKLSSGIYFYRMQAGKYVETKKLLLMK